METRDFKTKSIKISSFLLKYCFGEISIIIILLFTLNNFVGYERGVTIKSDGVGYYDYLPAIFIYGDMPNWKNKDIGYSDRINKIWNYATIEGCKINRYPCGTSLLLLPFFEGARLLSSYQGYPDDGFSPHFQRSVFWAAVFYLFLGLIFMRKLLLLYKISWRNIFFIQLLTVLATSILNYVNFDPSFSHVYSFFAITAFLYFVKAWFEGKKAKYFLWACLFFGLILILRQINLIIIFFIPFISGSGENMKQGFIEFIKLKWRIFVGLVITLFIVSIQLFLWYYQTKSFFVYSYPGESFNFLSPAFFDILFSYRKGLFVYTPILLITLFGCITLIKSRQYFLFGSWVLFFVFLTYILSSWWAWDYGMSYGLRAYIDFYIIFFILLALLIQNARKWLKTIIIVISLFTIPLNAIQAYQYKEYILHWNLMDKEKYWMVFLHQEDRFKGIFWKKKLILNSGSHRYLFSKKIEDQIILPNQTKQIHTINGERANDLDSTCFIQIMLENEFRAEQECKVELSARDSLTGKMYFKRSVPLIHFQELGLNKIQRGEYDFDLPTLKKENNVIINLSVIAGKDPVILKGIKIYFWKAR